MAQKGLSSSVGGPAGSLLDSCPADLWPRLRRLLAGLRQQGLQGTTSSALVCEAASCHDVIHRHGLTGSHAHVKAL